MCVRYRGYFNFQYLFCTIAGTAVRYSVQYVMHNNRTVNDIIRSYIFSFYILNGKGVVEYSSTVYSDTAAQDTRTSRGYSLFCIYVCTGVQYNIKVLLSIFLLYSDTLGGRYIQ